MAQQDKKYSKAIKLTGARSGISVVFEITPEMSEAKTSTYVEISDIRLPSSILIWMGSPSKKFNITAKLFARTQAEADRSFKYKNYLESWLYPSENLLQTTSVNNPQNSQSTNASSTGTSDPNSVGTKKTSLQNSANDRAVNSDSLFANEVPEIVYLEGHGGQFKKIPCVITSGTVTYPSDVDYVANSYGVMVPIIHDVSLALTEAREIDSGKNSIKSFDIKKYREGKLPGW